MAKRFAGVALAAVLACGWASGADAFPIVYTVTTVGSGSIGSLDFTNRRIVVSLRTDTDDVYFDSSKSAYENASGDVRVSISGVASTVVPDVFVYSNAGLYTGTAGFGYDNGSPQIVPFFSVFSQLLFNYDLKNLNGQNGDATYSYVNTPIGELDVTSIVANDYYPYGAAMFLAQDSLSAVPLPPAALLFGAALLGLAAAGYGTRRKGAAPQVN